MTRRPPTPRERRHRALHAFIDRGCPVSALAPGSKVPMKSCPQCDLKSPEYVRHRGLEDCPHPPDLCHGFHAATLDHDRAQSWIDRHPDLNFAISTGPARLVVIDLDRNKDQDDPPTRYQGIPGIVDGYDVFALAAERYGARYPTDTMHVATPSGGMHIWFTLPSGTVVNGSAGEFGWLVDVRSTGSYIIGPTSATKAGEYRRIGDVTAPAPAPDWLLHHLDGTGHTPKPPAPRRLPPRRAAPRHGRGTRALQDLVDELARAQEPERHKTLVRVTAAAAYMVMRGQCDEHDMRDQLHTAGLAADRTEREIHAAIESALAFASRGAAA